MTLFRKIRKDFVIKGQLKKYFMYAIGEILLVMMGISLAFQLDNWNDNRIKQNIEMRYYENIESQITDDKDLIEEQRNLNNGYLEQFKYANRILETNDRDKIDTLGVIIRNLTQYTDFDRQGNIYETLVNSGEIKILRNHEIVKGIRELEEKYIYVNRMENIHYDAMMSHVVMSISPLIKFSTSEIQKPEVVFEYEFQNLLLSLIQVMTEKDEVYNEALHEIEGITELIKIELKH
ncbi:hypothetical protein DKG77_04030 [Flagellimonas aquimarina]|uniref:Uncharacterized protein n=1 Tax=Flagellimonas aquimarina TaxID=2201895 RepID=A0A316L521_9FLAO|nr:DUF6090 family protein [Allomuricauda koreensis]PWL40005.1 hypothetical protein DKG77_04030 [Allomuricauda koreensis]